MKKEYKMPTIKLYRIESVYLLSGSWGKDDTGEVIEEPGSDPDFEE